MNDTIYVFFKDNKSVFPALSNYEMKSLKFGLTSFILHLTFTILIMMNNFQLKASSLLVELRYHSRGSFHKSSAEFTISQLSTQ
jgi:hypothetical protein